MVNCPWPKSSAFRKFFYGSYFDDIQTMIVNIMDWMAIILWIKPFLRIKPLSCPDIGICIQKWWLVSFRSENSKCTKSVASFFLFFRISLLHHLTHFLHNLDGPWPVIYLDGHLIGLLHHLYGSYIIWFNIRTPFKKNT